MTEHNHLLDHRLQDFIRKYNFTIPRKEGGHSRSKQKETFVCIFLSYSRYIFIFYYNNNKKWNLLSLFKALNYTQYLWFHITANNNLKRLCARLKATNQCCKYKRRFPKYIGFTVPIVSYQNKKDFTGILSPLFPPPNTGNVRANRHRHSAIRVSLSQFQPAVSDSPSPALTLIRSRNAAQPDTGFPDLLVKSNQLPVQGFQTECFTWYLNGKGKLWWGCVT